MSLTPSRPTNDNFLPAHSRSSEDVSGPGLSPSTAVLRYVAAFQNNTVDTSLDGICVRVLRGQTQADFESLSPDPDRRVVFIFGAAEATQLIGKSLEQILDLVGYSSQDIANHQQRRTTFKLFVGPAQEADHATWENLLPLCERAYPELQGRLLPWKTQLERTLLREIEREPGELALIANSSDLASKRMTLAKFMQIKQPTLWDIRAFLHHTINCNSLFAGDGFTRKNDGSLGGKEWVVCNQPLVRFSAHQLIDLGKLAFIE